MTLDQIVTVVALFLGPVFAVVVTLCAQRRTEVRSQRVAIFSTLMAYRADPFNAERIKALGLIDVVFHNAPEIRSKWKEYYETLNDSRYKDGQNDAVNVWRRKQNEMLAEMAVYLGYGKQIKYEEIERAYSPMQFVITAQQSQKVGKELLRVLENSETLGIPRRK